MTAIPLYGTRIATMRIDVDAVARLSARSKKTLRGLLREAGVSPNAYYSLARKETVLSGSIMRIAETLGVPASRLLTDEDPQLKKARILQKRVADIVRRRRGIDPDTVRHTLLLLRERPIERLRRALTRGQQPNIH